MSDPQFSAFVLQPIALLLQTAGLVHLILAVLWNRRRGRYGWSERARWLSAPGSAETSRVRPYLRDGATAPDPELAHLTVRVAEHRVRQFENPWQVTGASLAAMGIGLFAVGQAYSGHAPHILWLGLVLFTLATTAPLYRRSVLDRAERALETNRDLASQYDGPVGEPPQQAAPRER
ncbi:hypothetical protein [Nocardiopsis sp. B62]|uniref:hypothetical protein n=1 Tax=Nocardiopsis sp. B62 TaxID=2824874 RepID=UPI001B369517|nr:hypothetical protein [Nocardiopsis sp. B62]MBQ1082230.1 hypothetical protein [Nocardiopsis sp. B62]